MGLEVLRYYNVLYNEAKESKNKSNTCFSRHSLLPCSYLLGRPSCSRCGFFTCVFRDWSFTTRKKERQSCALGQHASHWLQTGQQHTPKGGSGCSSLAQPSSTLLTAKEVSSIFTEKKQMASFPFMSCQKVPVKVNFRSGSLILGVCPSTHSLSMCCFLPARQAKHHKPKV